jgi:hypothetical protein
VVRCVAVAASCLLLACGAVGSPPASTVSGQPLINVTGILDRAQVPACPIDEPCGPPATSRVVFSSSGHPDVGANLGSDGSFALHLDPGTYGIRAAPPPLHGGIVPAEVRVPATGTVELHLKIQ